MQKPWKQNKNHYMNSVAHIFEIHIGTIENSLLQDATAYAHKLIKGLNEGLKKVGFPIN